MFNINRISSIGRTYRHLDRYRQILGVLFKYGFDELINTLNLEKHLKIGLKLIPRDTQQRVASLSRAERLRMSMEELGPAFVKLGQILSSRPDLIPPEFLLEFSKLHDHVSPFGFDEVCSILNSEFGKPYTEIFAGLEEKPLASASIGQVHRGELADGKVVAVKIQRPGVHKIIETDLEIMLHLALIMEKHLEGAQYYQPSRIVEEFSRVIDQELDYRIEAVHMERFAAQFREDDTICVPEVMRDMTTSRVLIMQYIEGIKVSDIESLSMQGLDSKIIAERGAVLTLKQIFEHSLFHADPHPGNIVILPENVICYLDYGMMGRSDIETREEFAEMLAGIVKQDRPKVARALLNLTLWDVEPEPGKLDADIALLIENFVFRPLKEVEFGKLLYQLLEITAKHRLRLKPELYLMLKVIGTIDSLGRKLDPEFDISKKTESFVSSVQMARLDPRRIYDEMSTYTKDVIRLMKVLPLELRRLLAQLRQGRVKIEFQHRGMEPMLSTLDHVSNRIAFAIVLASLIIGSSLIVLSGVPPKWLGIPVIGIVGYIIAGIMGFWLLWSILRGGKL